MLKMVIESWKLENISHDEFVDHLTHVHGPLVARHGPALGFCEYYQNQRVENSELDAFSRQQGWPPAPNSMHGFGSRMRSR